MKKILKKLQIIFAVVLLCYNAIFIPKNNVVKADGGVLSLGGGLVLSSASSAALPFILVALVAVVILGLTIDNWDELQALGQSISLELNKLGASIYDFVSGTSVTVNDTLKKAIFNAADNMGDALPGYTGGSYFGNGSYSAFTGVSNGNVNLIRMESGGALWLGNLSKYSGGGLGWTSTRFDKNKDLVASSLSVTVNIQPITSTQDLILQVDLYSGGKIKAKSQDIIRDSSGNVISITSTYAPVNSFDKLGGIFLRGSKAKYNVTSLTIPELGIGVQAPEVPTAGMRVKEYNPEVRQKVADTVFNTSSSTITFNPDAAIVNATVLGLPAISDKVYDSSQSKTLEDVLAGTGANAGSITSGAGSIPGIASGSGILNLSGLWDWLKKLLDAILGLPAAILAGLKALWQGLTNILSDILKAISSLGTIIGKYILDGLKDLFGVDSAWLSGRIEHLKLRFSEKFPSINPINYHFTDKDSLSDITVDFPIYGRQTVVSGSVATEFARIVKQFLRALFYILLALFFFRKFHKTAEG